MVDLDELKSKFLNTEFASRELQIDADNLFGKRHGIRRAGTIYRSTDADFQATPAYLCSISSGRHLPIDFPWAAYLWTAAKPWSDLHRYVRHPIVGQSPLMTFTTKKADRAA